MWTEREGEERKREEERKGGKIGMQWVDMKREGGRRVMLLCVDRGKGRRERERWRREKGGRERDAVGEQRRRSGREGGASNVLTERGRRKRWYGEEREDGERDVIG